GWRQAVGVGGALPGRRGGRVVSAAGADPATGRCAPHAPGNRAADQGARRPYQSYRLTAGAAQPTAGPHRRARLGALGGQTWGAGNSRTAWPELAREGAARPGPGANGRPGGGPAAS